jgi:ABC-type sugar transport system permease subunit
VYWFVLGALGVYNFFNIRKYREDYGKAQYIAYVVSIIVLIAMFFLLRSRAQNC